MLKVYFARILFTIVTISKIDEDGEHFIRYETGDIVIRSFALKFLSAP